jgi:hypothetical protein
LRHRRPLSSAHTTPHHTHIHNHIHHHFTFLPILSFPVPQKHSPDWAVHDRDGATRHQRSVDSAHSAYSAHYSVKPGSLLRPSVHISDGGRRGNFRRGKARQVNRNASRPAILSTLLLISSRSGPTARSLARRRHVPPFVVSRVTSIRRFRGVLPAVIQPPSSCCPGVPTCR